MNDTEMKKKEWVPIAGYENYLVSNYGEVINSKTGKKIMNSKKHRPFVYLFKDGKGQSMQISRLVAQAFIPNPNQYEQVNHINGNNADNYVENLEWCTRQHNYVHANLFGLNPTSHKKESAVTIYMNYGMVKQLYEIIKRERVDISHFVVKAIREHIEKMQP